MALSSILSRNTNLLQPNKFRLVFGQFPNVVYRCMGTNLPGISLGRLVQTSPFAARPIPSSKLIYDDLELTFAVDEDMKNWLEIHNWMRAIGKPTSYEERRRIQPNPNNIFSGQEYTDAIVLVMSSKNNPTYEIQFKDTWPMRLTPIEWKTTTDAAEVIVATVTLAYLYYDVVPLKSGL